MYELNASFLIRHHSFIIRANNKLKLEFIGKKQLILIHI